MAHLLETKENMKSPSKLVKKDSDSHSCVQIKLSQELILGHNFAQTFHISTLWNASDVMPLTRNGQPFAEHTAHK